MMKRILLITLILFSGRIMAEGIFIHDLNKASNRYVILDELNESAVMYLSEVGSQKPVKDAFAYMRVAPVDFPTWKERMSAGEPPILHDEIASKQAIISTTNESDFIFKWSPDGEAVALVYKKQPIAFISLNEKYGFSKAVKGESPIVNPWDEALYDDLFN